MLHLPGDYAEKLKGEAQIWSAESYNSVPSAIALVGEIKPLSETRTMPGGDSGTVRPLYKKRTVLAGDYVLHPRAIGGYVDPGHEGEGRVHIFKQRGFSRKWVFPQELLDAMNIDSLMAWARERAEAFGRILANTKEESFFRLFNKGGFLAGDEIFINTVPGVNDQGSAAGLYIDGKPVFALSGNNHPALNGSTYYNATANALNYANFKTAVQLVEGTNNRDEYGNIIQIMVDTLLTGRPLKETAVEINTARGKPETGNNDGSGMPPNLQLVSTPFITDTDAWYVGQRGQGVCFYDDNEVIWKVAPEEGTNSLCLYAHTYWALGFHDWRFWCSNALATS